VTNKTELIFFDIGSVLIFQKRHPLEAISEKLDLNLDNAKSAHEESRKHKDFDTNYKNIRNLDDHRRFSEYAAKLFLDEMGLPHSREFMEIVMTAWMKQEYGLMPGAIEILEYLKPKYRLGVISNGTPSRRHNEMVDFELLPYFDPIVLSREVGMEKPDTSIFKLALDMAKISPAKTAFVDDKPSFLSGAHKSGIKNLFQVTAFHKLELFEQATEISNLLELKTYF